LLLLASGIMIIAEPIMTNLSRFISQYSKSLDSFFIRIVLGKALFGDEAFCLRAWGECRR
jgi:hypothetical protein